ncbi:uncharacterized protein FA14DRAFT_162257 [Meira miltonrushii]|uniref:Plus3 domain-containing protein n=1 Tax=Meira miltonrushii TaxID=1280837 RepID=A0A316V6U0_9BASI|nr:uncharacterized protein FA14DRAFT_162257 [Meira miltonrushii]PWN31913.1 hypothetical protein FA14DRAFT_162257 [Meira miltonrushii]
MSDVDDELLALVGNGSSSSRSGSPAKRRTKRRRNANSRRDLSDDDDDQSDDLDAEGSDDDEVGVNEPVNPFRLEGIYKDEEDRERLLDMPELDREAELASRRDLITQRRQKADLRAMVRTQQLAGRKSSGRSSSKPAKKKSRKLKKASSVSSSKRRRRADSDEEEDDFDEDDEEDEEEEEEEESDFETARRGSRARKGDKPSGKAAQLQKLKKSRAKVQRRRQGDDDDESSAQETSESEYDAEEAEALWRSKKERERRERGESKRGAAADQKPSREQDRLAKRGEWKFPDLKDINIARVKRDHLSKLVHKPDWMSQIVGKFARINFTDRDKATGRITQTYRLVQISDCYQGDDYYELGDQYTNALCTMQAGEEKMSKVLLKFISNSEVTDREYDEFRSRVDKMSGHRAQRVYPSREATLDQADELEAFVSKPFTEQDINQMLKEKRSARDAFENSERNKSKQRQQQHLSGSSKTEAGANELLMLQMNEKHRRADQKRIADAERKIALQNRLAAQRLNSNANTPSGTPPRSGTPLNGLASNGATQGTNSPLVKPATSSTPLSLAIAAADIDVDLGDF